VDIEVSKSVLKLATVQHLYGRIAATLPPTPGVGARGADISLLAALHPTPAVCGRPQGAARAWLAEREGFDRGFYAGPFGWVTGQGAEFVVAIRSALLPEGGDGGGGGGAWRGAAGAADSVDAAQVGGFRWRRERREPKRVLALLVFRL
jgi:anthranilate/para-aminobenzoate synthase component I